MEAYFNPLVLADRDHRLTGNHTKTAGKHTIIATIEIELGPVACVLDSSCNQLTWQVAMRDAQLLHLFADEALEKYSELNGQNLILGSKTRSACCSP